MPQPTTGRGPLDALPSILHAVFIQTAGVFNDPRKLNPRAVVGIPVFIDRFQLALDLLEVEILNAKATLRRDLEVLRQRAEEEARVAAEQEKRAKGLTEQDEEEAGEKVEVDQQQRQA